MDRRSPLLVAALCSLVVCSEVSQPSPREHVGSKSSALAAEPKPPEREIRAHLPAIAE